MNCGHFNKLFLIQNQNRLHYELFNNLPSKSVTSFFFFFFCSLCSGWTS